MLKSEQKKGDVKGDVKRRDNTIVIGKPKPILRKRRMNRKPIIKPGQASRLTAGQKRTDAIAEEPPKQKNSLKFAAPIKIIVIDPKSEYCKTLWCAVGIALTNVAIGAVLMSIFFYAVTQNDAHSVVCAFAYHFFAAEAILALHYANGWSSPMRTRHRKFAHVFLHVCGIICAAIGTTIIILNVGFGKKMTTQPHGLTGILTGMLAILSVCFGPVAYFTKMRWPSTLHMSLGLITFIMSSFCVCFGLTLKLFKAWAGDTVMYVLIVLVIYYTVFIVTGSFMKCVSRF